MKVQQYSAEKLVLVDRPVMIRVIVATFLLAGLFLLALDLLAKKGFGWGGLFLVGLSVYLFFRYEQTSLAVFDRLQQQLRIRRSRWFRIIPDEIYPLEEIAQVKLQSKSGPDKEVESPRYRLVVIHHQKGDIPLTAGFKPDTIGFESLVKKANEFLPFSQ
ncbi:MAG: hypothetical protein AAGI38_03555 [Bacteroidota bacterium]